MFTFLIVQHHSDHWPFRFGFKILNAKNGTRPANCTDFFKRASLIVSYPFKTTAYLRIARRNRWKIRNIEQHEVIECVSLIAADLGPYTIVVMETFHLKLKVRMRLNDGWTYSSKQIFVRNQSSFVKYE